MATNSVFWSRFFFTRFPTWFNVGEIPASSSNKPNRHIYLFYASRSLYDAFEQSRKPAYIYLPITYIGLDTSAHN